MTPRIVFLFFVQTRLAFLMCTILYTIRTNSNYLFYIPIRSRDVSSATRYCSSCGAAHLPETVVCSACGLSLKITAPLTAVAPAHLLLQERYRILAQSGTGGSSAVYKAEDTLLNNRLAAIKVISLHGLQPQLALQGTPLQNSTARHRQHRAQISIVLVQCYTNC